MKDKLMTDTKPRFQDGQRVRLSVDIDGGLLRAGDEGSVALSFSDALSDFPYPGGGVVFDGLSGVWVGAHVGGVGKRILDIVEAVEPIAAPAQRTPAEIADLKRQWLNDPSWDIEDTEGFEAHRDELLAWRLKDQAEQARKALEREAARDIQTISAPLGAHRARETQQADDRISDLLKTGWRIIDVSVTSGETTDIRHVTLMRDAGSTKLVDLEKRIMALERRKRADDDFEDWKTGRADALPY